jgi:hypothetical protein
MEFGRRELTNEINEIVFRVPFAQWSVWDCISGGAATEQFGKSRAKERRGATVKLGRVLALACNAKQLRFVPGLTGGYQKQKGGWLFPEQLIEATGGHG